MTTPKTTSPPTNRREGRGSLSGFESLFGLNDVKAQEVGAGSAVLYLRVSTQRQLLTAIDLDPDGNSIATQREATIKRAKRMKAPVIKEFVEPGHSAQSIAKRPIFREHTGDGYSSKSSLSPPTPIELAKLAQLSRRFPCGTPTKVDQTALPRRVKRRLSPEARAAIVERHKAGETVKVSSREFGISESGLRDLLAVDDVEIRKPSMTTDDIDLAVQLYESGLTVKELVQRIGYLIGTIRRMLREHGVVMRPHNMRQMTRGG